MNGIPVTYPRNNHSDILMLINVNTIAWSNNFALINAARLINHVKEQDGVPKCIYGSIQMEFPKYLLIRTVH